MPEEGSAEQFLVQLRRALQHLYDPVELRRNLLQNLLPLDPAIDPVTALRKTLQDAVQALKPGEDIPLGSNAWRTFDVLSYRFIEQSSQKEVAADMSLSIRQLQRLETSALEALRDHLISHYNLKDHPGSLASLADAGLDQAPTPGPDSGSPSMALEQEYEWLKKSSQNEEIEVAQLVESTLTTIAPLIQAMDTQIEVHIAASLPKVDGQITILRQILINLFTAALRIAENGQVRLRVTAEMGKMHIQLTALPTLASQPEMATPEIEEILSVARQLVDLSRGTLTILPQTSSQRAFEASLILPAAQRVVVLVVDDNTDTLLLLERYLAGSRYQFVGGRDPTQAFALIETHHPDIIILDVMLPGIDGWELLGRIKGNPKTGQIPVIISTILPQESLALMLGAAAFLRKPFTQVQFLEVLERQTGQQIPESS